MYKVLLFVLVLVFQKAIAVENIIDLSWDFGEQAIFPPGLRNFSYTKQAGTDEKGYWYAANEYCAAEHGGTHFDAPYHFYQQGWRVIDVPIQRLFAKGVLVNLTSEHLQLGRETALTVKHLQDWETRHGAFESESVLFVDFGRSKYYRNRTTYLDMDSDGIMHFPGISMKAAQWIVDSGKFYGVAVDTPSIDPGNTTDYSVHTMLAKNSLYNLENVKYSEELPEKGFEIIVAPMKIEKGTGAPVRIFAAITENTQ